MHTSQLFAHFSHPQHRLFCISWCKEACSCGAWVIPQRKHSSSAFQAVSYVLMCLSGKNALSAVLFFLCASVCCTFALDTAVGGKSLSFGSLSQSPVPSTQPKIEWRRLHTCAHARTHTHTFIPLLPTLMLTAFSSAPPLSSLFFLQCSQPLLQCNPSLTRSGGWGG